MVPFLSQSQSHLLVLKAYLAVHPDHLSRVSIAPIGIERNVAFGRQHKFLTSQSHLLVLKVESGIGVAGHILVSIAPIGIESFQQAPGWLQTARLNRTYWY